MAVPPDIDSSIASVKMCSLIDIDYFKKLSAENNSIKLKEAKEAENLIELFKDDIIKEVLYHDIIKNISDIENTVNEKGIRHLFYSLRKHSDKNGVEAVNKWLKSYIKEYGK